MLGATVYANQKHTTYQVQSSPEARCWEQRTLRAVRQMLDVSILSQLGAGSNNSASRRAYLPLVSILSQLGAGSNNSASRRRIYPWRFNPLPVGARATFMPVCNVRQVRVSILSQLGAGSSEILTQEISLAEFQSSPEAGCWEQPGKCARRFYIKCFNPLPS